MTEKEPYLYRMKSPSHRVHKEMAEERRWSKGKGIGNELRSSFGPSQAAFDICNVTHASHIVLLYFIIFVDMPLHFHVKHK